LAKVVGHGFGQIVERRLRHFANLGLNAGLFREYVEHIADRRLERIGLTVKFGSKNPFPWMSETIDLGKEKNFFETRVTEYQTGGSLAW
jgi:ribonucleoside-diphosphate reductase beta chain